MIEQFVLWKCRLFNEEKDIVSFLFWFKGLSTAEKEDYLLSVMREYGISSDQFYFVVQGFIFYVMMRHGLYWDEDVFQDAVLSVMEKVKYWDKSRGNLLSFLYSLIRDKVSQKKYWDTVKSFRNKEFDEKIGCHQRDKEREEDRSENSDEAVEVDLLWDMLIGEVSSEVIHGVRSEVLESIRRGEDSVYRRVVLWYIISDSL
jgi:hypothetical protein